MISEITIPVKKGRFKTQVKVRYLQAEGRIYFKFDFSDTIRNEIKAMDGSQYHGYEGAPDRAFCTKTFGTDKIWSIKDSQRNQFQFDFLQGKNPYARYDRQLIEVQPERPTYIHQNGLISHGITVHYGIWASEPGTGKTLAEIEVLERTYGITNPEQEVWHIGPRSALKAVEREFRHWGAKIWPRMMSYDELRSVMQQWKDGDRAPRIVFMDEAHKVKNPTAARSQAAKALADGVRSDWGEDGSVVLMTGSPAPKSPADWYWLCEIACPGFLKEGNIEKFRLRLGIFEKRESFAGGIFNQHVAWRDDERKCEKCGLLADDPIHDLKINTEAHPHQKSVNEVHHLYKRMKGLVVVNFKKDCLAWLPDKIYKLIECKPEPATLRALQIIMSTSKTAASALVRSRELSDGFQYIETIEGTQECSLCKGTRRVNEMVVKEGVEYRDWDSFYTELSDIQAANVAFDAYNATNKEWRSTECTHCDGTGEEDRIIRETKEVPCPKDDLLRDDLDEHHDIGRLVLYGGFQGSIDRIVRICKEEKWSIIRVDGRGWFQCDCNSNPMPGDPLGLFQDAQHSHPRIAFIGQAGAAGTGLTLTASPTIACWSNDFDAASRIQLEDRIHRPGMDLNKGATIKDYIHLLTDLVILNNLNAKRRLQDMSLGQLHAQIEEAAGDARLF